MASKKKKKKVKKKKAFQLLWIFESFEDHESFFSKRMFGGLAIYVHGRMVMLLAETPGDREYRGKNFDFDIWNGILFPTEHEHQKSMQKKFPNLLQHPILKKWLYLPVDSEQFDDDIHEISLCISRNDPHFGIYPKMN